VVQETYFKYRWIIWGTMCSAFLIVFIQRYSIAVIATDLAGELNLTGVQLSNLSSMYFYAYAFMQIPVGIMADKYGPRKITTVGMSIATLATFLFSFSNSVYVIFFSRFLMGASFATIFVSILKIISVWFPPNRFSTLTGWTSLVGNVGGMLASAPLALLVTLVGWRVSLTSIGVFSFLLVFMLWFIVRDYPEDSNQELVIPKGNSDNKISHGLKLIITNPQMWVNFLIVFSVMGTIASFSGLWGIPYLMHVYQISRSSAANYILIFTFGVTMGSLFMGPIERIFSSRKRIIQVIVGIFTMLWAILILIFRCMPVSWLVPLIFFVMGFTGILIMLLFVNVKEMSPLQYSGLATGFINFAPFIGAAILNTMVGFILDLNWDGLLVGGARIYNVADYQKGFLIYLCFSSLAFILSLIFLRERKAKD